MGKKNTVDSDFWIDNYLSDIDPLEKYLYLYFITSPHSNVAGIYQIPIKVISVDTGIEKTMIEKMIKRFQDSGKILYREGWLCLRNRTKYNKKDNNSVKTGVDEIISKSPYFIKEFLELEQSTTVCDSLSPTHIIRYDGIELNSDTEKIDFDEYLKKWNASGFTKINGISESRKKHLRARLKDKAYNFDEIIKKMQMCQNDFMLKYFKFDWITDNDNNWRKVVEGNYMTYKKKETTEDISIFNTDARTVYGKKVSDQDFTALKSIYKKDGETKLKEVMEKIK